MFTPSDKISEVQCDYTDLEATSDGTEEPEATPFSCGEGL